MMATAFLGFFYIALNGFYSIQQNQQKKNKQKQVQLHYGEKNSNLFRLNEVNTPQGVRYYSTKKNCANNNCINNTKLNSIMIYDLLLEYSKKLHNFPHSTGKIGTDSISIYTYTDYIDESVLILKNMEDSYKTDPDTFKLIFELYIYVYLLSIEPVIKNAYSDKVVKSNFMLDFEKKVHLALKEYSLNYSKSKKIIKSNNTDKDEKIYWSIENDSVSFRNISKTLEKFILEKNLNPVFIYEDLLDENLKSRVLNETRGLSGIYLILNKVTLDYYIGSASTGKFYARFSNHLFNFHGSKVVKNAVKKYGISCFAFFSFRVIS